MLPLGVNKIDLVLCDVFTSFMRASSRRSNHRLAAYAHPRKWQDSRTTDTDNGAEYALLSPQCEARHDP